MEFLTNFGVLGKQLKLATMVKLKRKMALQGKILLSAMTKKQVPTCFYQFCIMFGKNKK